MIRFDVTLPKVLIVSLTPLITGIGLCTPLGNTADRTWNALLGGRFVADHARVPDVDSGNHPRINTLALRVAREAIANAGWKYSDLEDAAMIVGTSKGPVDHWLDQLASQPGNASGQPAGEPATTFGLGETAAFVASTLHIHGPRLTLSAACASGLIALIRATLLIRAGELKRAVVIAAESSLHPLFIGSFDRLGVLAPQGVGCRPFDENRSGFVISEAAAAICVQAAEAAQICAQPLSVVSGFALGADGAHLTGGDVEGKMLRQALARAIGDEPPDLVHAHGTGTPTNDPVELAAIEYCLHDSRGPRANLYSHKGALGHSLGAAGLVSVVLNCLSHRHGVIPPNVQTRNPLSARNVLIDGDLCRRDVQRSLAIAAGFGGAIAAISITNADRR